MTKRKWTKNEEEAEEQAEMQREKDLQYSRWKLAAMLPVLIELVDNVWPPLKKRIVAAEPQKQ